MKAWISSVVERGKRGHASVHLAETWSTEPMSRPLSATLVPISMWLAAKHNTEGWRGRAPPLQRYGLAEPSRSGSSPLAARASTRA